MDCWKSSTPLCRGRLNPLRCGKIPDSRSKERLAFVAGNVLGNLGAGSFGMAHLAEDAAAGRGTRVSGPGRNAKSHLVNRLAVHSPEV